MTYALSAALQAAVYARLSTDSALSTLVGSSIYDALPPGVAPALYVVIGAEKVRDQSDKTGRGAEHDFIVSVVTDVSGFAGAKAAAGAVADSLVDAPLALSRGNLVALGFVRAVAARVGAGGERQIDLTFRARVEDDAPGS